MKSNKLNRVLTLSARWYFKFTFLSILHCLMSLIEVWEVDFGFVSNVELKSALCLLFIMKRRPAISCRLKKLMKGVKCKLACWTRAPALLLIYPTDNSLTQISQPTQIIYSNWKPCPVSSIVILSYWKCELGDSRKCQSSCLCEERGRNLA